LIKSLEEKVFLEARQKLYSIGEQGTEDSNYAQADQENNDHKV
jgi:hypothetical protein